MDDTLEGSGNVEPVDTVAADQIATAAIPAATPPSPVAAPFDPVQAAFAAKKYGWDNHMIVDAYSEGQKHAADPYAPMKAVAEKAGVYDGTSPFDPVLAIKDAVAAGPDGALLRQAYIGAIKQTADPWKSLRALSTDPGIVGSAVSGFKEGMGDFSKLPGAVNREQPDDTDQAAPAIPFLKHPIERAAHDFASSFPEFAGAVMGGAMATGAVGGPEDPLSLVAAPVGMALGAGAVSTVKSIGPYYQEALKQTKDPDQAYDQAMKQAATAGAFTGLSFGAFEAGPGAMMVKSLLKGITPEARTAAVDAIVATNAKQAAKGLAEAPVPTSVFGQNVAAAAADASANAPGAFRNLMQQVAIQGGLGGAGQVAQNAETDQSLGNNLATGAMQGAVGAALPMAAHSAITGLFKAGAKYFPNTRDAVTGAPPPPGPDDPGTPPPPVPGATDNTPVGGPAITPPSGAPGDFSLKPDAQGRPTLVDQKGTVIMDADNIGPNPQTVLDTWNSMGRDDEEAPPAAQAAAIAAKTEAGIPTAVDTPAQADGKAAAAAKLEAEATGQAPPAPPAPPAQPTPSPAPLAVPAEDIADRPPANHPAAQAGVPPVAEPAIGPPAPPPDLLSDHGPDEVPPEVSQNIYNQPPTPPPPQTDLLQPIPREPLSLIGFLRKQGGLKDDTFSRYDQTRAGQASGTRNPSDLRSIGGDKASGLIRAKTGMDLDDAARAATEAGYFPEAVNSLDGRASPNDLLDAISEELGGNKRYSTNDADQALAYTEAGLHNEGVQRLADQYGIDPKGKTREQFSAELSEKEGQAAQERDHASLSDSIEAEHAEAERQAREYVEARGDAWEPDDVYRGASTRTLEDLENEQRERDAAEAASPVVGGDDQSEAAAGDQGVVPGRGGEDRAVAAAREDHGSEEVAEATKRNNLTPVRVNPGELGESPRWAVVVDGQEWHLEQNKGSGGAAINGGWYGNRAGADPDMQGFYLGDTRKDAVSELVRKQPTPRTHDPFSGRPLIDQAQRPSEEIQHWPQSAVDYSREELSSLVAAKKADDDAKLRKAFGSDARVKRFNELDRKRNSSNPQRADEGEAEFEQEFGNLTPEQERLVYGIGETGLSHEDLRSIELAHSDTAFTPADSNTDVAYVMSIGARKMDPERIASVQAGGGSGEDQANYIRMQDGFNELKRRGLSNKQIEHEAVQALVAVGWKASDAADVLDRFGRAQAKPAPVHDRLLTADGVKDQAVIPGAEARSPEEMRAAEMSAAADRLREETQLRRQQSKMRGENRSVTDQVGGLFDRARDQRSLLSGEHSENDGVAVDHTDAVRDALADRGDKTPDQAVADYLVKQGEETGNEHMIVRNGAGDAVLYAGTSGLVKQVDLPPAVGLAMDNPSHNLVIDHNHPGPASLSAPDLDTLGYPGVDEIRAHSPDGSTHAARLTDNAREIARANPNQARASLQNIMMALAGALDRRLAEWEKNGHLPPADYEQVHSDLMNRALSAAGITEYHSPLKDTARLSALTKNAVRETATMAKQMGQAFWRLNNDKVLDRSAGTRSANEEMGGFPPRHAGVGSESVDGPVHDQNSGSRTNAARTGPEATPEPVVEGRDLTRAPRPTRPPRELKYPEQGLGEQRPDETVRTPVEHAQQYQDEVGAAVGREIEGQGPSTVDLSISRNMPPRAGPEKMMDLNAVQRVSMFPRVLASIDTRFARLYNAWKMRTSLRNTLSAKYRDLAPTYREAVAKGEKDSLNRVFGALELDRIYQHDRGENPKSMRVFNNRNDGTRYTKVGDDYTLTPREQKMYVELRNQFRAQWNDVMMGVARRMGYDGPWSDKTGENIHNIMALAEGANPAHAKDMRAVAKMVAGMEMQRRQPYMPMMRFGDYYVAVKPREGLAVDKADSRLGGFPELKWFELAERPQTEDWKALGRQTNANDVPPWAKAQIDAAKKRFGIKGEMNKPHADDQYELSHDFVFRKPEMLRSLDIPAIEKLLMLTEGGVKRAFYDDAAAHLPQGTTKAKGKEFAKAEMERRYEDMYGRLIDEIKVQMYKEMTAGFRKPARVIPGYSHDFTRTLGAYNHWIANHVSDSLHGDTIERAYNAIVGGVADSGAVKGHNFASVRAYTKAWREWQESQRNPWSKASQTATQLGFLYTMAGNISSMIPIATHTPIFGWLALHHGTDVGKATATMAKAAAEVYGQVRMNAKHGLHIPIANLGKNAAEKAYLAKMESEGETHPIGMHDIAASFDPAQGVLGKHSAMAKQIYGLIGSNISAIDRANRLIMALSSHRLAQDPAYRANALKAFGNNQYLRAMHEQHGQTPEALSRFLMSEGAFDWGKQNAAPMMRYGGQAWFLLHGFQTRALSMMWNYLTRQGPAGRMALLYAAFPLVTLTGLSGAIPFIQDAGNLTDAAYKFFTNKDPMIGARIRALASDQLFGKVGAEMMTEGAAPSLLGVDLSDRLGFGDPISREMDSFDFMGTVPGIMWSRIQGARKRAMSGQTMSAIGETMPQFIREPLLAADRAAHGYRTQSGKVLVPASKLSAADIAKQAIGFTPTPVSRALEKANEEYVASRARMPAPHNVIPTS